jgi:hypothetical protein
MGESGRELTEVEGSGMAAEKSLCPAINSKEKKTGKWFQLCLFVVRNFSF